jgi:[ribosomal protein S18]-alanine N-acetyltransferase
MARGIRIEPFRWSQIRRILAIENAAFPREAYEKELFLELHRDCADLFFIAKQSGRIAGYIVTCTTRGGAEIISIAVDPLCRKRGLGAALMRHTLRKLRSRGIRTIRLMVRSTNAEGIRFYRSFGFLRERRVARYYEDGGEGIQMRLRL